MAGVFVVVGRYGGAVNEDEALPALKATFDTLDGWRERLRETDDPPAGSAFELDDRAWWPFPLSSCAWSKLASAVDHLQAVRIMVDAGSLHPIATFTLTRSALLAASEALWLLGPEDRALRQSRGLWLAEVADKEHLLWSKEAAKGPGVIWPALAALRVTREAHLRGYPIARHDLPSPGPTSGLDVIAWAAQYLQPGREEWVAQARAQWRQGSGNAHSHAFAAMSSDARERGRSSDGKLRVYGVGGSPLRTFHAYHVPFETCRRAWSRWEELRRPDVLA